MLYASLPMLHLLQEPQKIAAGIGRQVGLEAQQLRWVLWLIREAKSQRGPVSSAFRI